MPPPILKPPPNPPPIYCVKAKISQTISHAVEHWRTTTAGFLAFVIGTCGPLAAYLASQNSPKAASAAGIVTLVSMMARVWVGMLMNDGTSSTTTTTTAGVASSTREDVTATIVKTS